MHLSHPSHSIPALPPDPLPPLIQPVDLPHFGFGQARRPSWSSPLTRKTFLQRGQVNAALFPSQSSSCFIELRSIVLTGMSHPSLLTRLFTQYRPGNVPFAAFSMIVSAFFKYRLSVL